MLRRNGPVVRSMESLLRLVGLWLERFVKEVGLAISAEHKLVTDGQRDRHNDS